MTTQRLPTLVYWIWRIRRSGKSPRSGSCASSRVADQRVASAVAGGERRVSSSAPASLAYRLAYATAGRYGNAVSEETRACSPGWPQALRNPATAVESSEPTRQAKRSGAVISVEARRLAWEGRAQRLRVSKELRRSRSSGLARLLHASRSGAARSKRFPRWKHGVEGVPGELPLYPCLLACAYTDMGREEDARPLADNDARRSESRAQ